MLKQLNVHGFKKKKQKPKKDNKLEQIVDLNVTYKAIYFWGKTEEDIFKSEPRQRVLQLKNP